VADAVRESAVRPRIKPGRYGAAMDELPGVVLQERRPSAMVQINGAPDEDSFAQALGFVGLDASPRPRRACPGKAATLLWNGPGRWQALSMDAPPARLVNDLRDALKDGDATVTDLSHARSVVRITGPRACEVLLQGCPLDLESYGENDCAASLLGHLNVQLHGLGDGGFDVYVLRSFGVALWEWLYDASLEYGLEVRSSDS
jgi:sarcosine oxidase subunit gamma